MPSPPSPRTCHTAGSSRPHDERVAVDAHDEHACELRELGARLEVAAESVVCHVTLQVQGLLVHRVHRLGRRSVVGMRGTEKTVGAREPARRPTHTPLPASTRPAAGSTHTLPLFLGYTTIPYLAKIRNPGKGWSLREYLVNIG